MTPACPLCDDLGMVIHTDERGRRFARECACQVERRIERTLLQARIPRRYALCSFDTFDYSHHESIGRAFAVAHHFTLAYPVETNGKGLLFTGSPGLGKTHLAISILRDLIRSKGATGQFWEHKELLEKLRSFYDLRTAGAENQLLRSIITCDVLVLDDLGELSPSDWVWDTTAYILNARYNENLSTIVTTNRSNEPAMQARPAETGSALASVRLASRKETLGDRIGDRMRSRLQEMCVSLHLEGADRRELENRARFG